MLWELIQTMPDSTACAMRWPRLRSEVQMYAARPNRVAFASSTASASSSKGATATTGPKISSWKIRASLATSAKTVGWR